MASGSMEFPTTFVYSPLQSRRHIRLLEFMTRGTEENFSGFSYSLVQYEIPADDAQGQFEAVSYTWGSHERVSSLHLHCETGSIGLTANLTEALPHLSRQSQTKRVWIDQLCINQSDDVEKSVQVGLMSEIYKKAKRVIIWLGPGDDNITVCQQWLREIDELVPSLDIADQITPGCASYNADARSLFLRKTFNDSETLPIFAPAIQAFWNRPYFRRGWIVQEFLLARELIFLTETMSLTFQNLVDLFNVPDAAEQDAWVSHKFLMLAKLYPFTDPAPLRFLRLMGAVASEFQTVMIVDRLFGVLGLMEGLRYTPDYRLSVKENFTRFAITLAKDYGSLDFLSLWAANLDPLVPGTPLELKGFPSWVPSWTPTPLFTPWRLVTGGSNHYRSDIKWNAAAGRTHTHDQVEEVTTTQRLYVRGRTIDRIDTISSVKFTKYFDGVDEVYLTSLVDHIKCDISGLETWTYIDLVRFLNVVAANGGEPEKFRGDLLGLTSQNEPNTFRNMSGSNERLGLALAMGRGRRVVRTEKGRLGLAPAVGIQARSGEEEGSVIVVLHGCKVPVVLKVVNEERREWSLLGDCYVEGVMLGEAVDWAENDTQEFVLV